MRYPILLIALCLLLGACQQSPHKNFYVLAAPTAVANDSGSHLPTTIGIGPIEVADYLDRTQIVYETADGSLAFAPNAYWAEPLNHGIARVLALHLTERETTRSFVNFPWRADSRPTHSLRVQIHSLKRADGQASINATWELMDVSGKENIERRRFVRTTPAASGAHALTQAYSKLIAELAQEMDVALQNLRATSP